MKNLALIFGVFALVVSVSCVQQSPGRSTRGSAGSSLDLQPSALVLSATIEFGRGDVGSPFPPVPPPPHDQSGHAVDSLFPREVVIDQGGTVTFPMSGGVHQVAIYEDGTSPKDIDTDITKTGCFNVPLIDDSDGRIAVLSDQPCAGGNPSPSYQFDTPGRYLVICTFLPHFEVGMYGWVTVRKR